MDVTMEVQDHAVSCDDSKDPGKQLASSVEEGNTLEKPSYGNEIDSEKYNKEENVTLEDKQAECHRMQQLRKALERTVERCVTSGKLSLFASAYPNLFSKKYKVLKNLQDQFQTQLRENIKCEIELMFHEEQVPELMNELDGIIAEQGLKENKNPAWRPSHDVFDNLRPHLMAVKLKQKEKLTDLLSDVNAENKQLQDALVKKRQQLMKTVEKCEMKVEGLVNLAEDLDKDY